MKTDEEIIQSLIAGGIIGAMLGSILSNNTKEEKTLGAIAGAAILASYKANEKAQKSNIPYYIEEEGILFEVNSKGEKKFIKSIVRPATILGDHFKLK